MRMRMSTTPRTTTTRVFRGTRVRRDGVYTQRRIGRRRRDGGRWGVGWGCTRDDARGRLAAAATGAGRDAERVEDVFELITEEVEVVCAGGGGGGVSASASASAMIIKVVRPRWEDAVIEYYIKRGTLDSDPYWAAVWPSARATAKYIGTNGRAAVRDRDVCDLGCGLGLAGLAACAAGAKKVTFYDREPLATQCAMLSARANGWGDAVVSARVFDWNDVRTDQEKFDTVLACDVLYEHQAVEPVAALVPKLVKSGGGRFLLGDPPKRTPRNRAMFSSLLVEQYGAFLMREWLAELGNVEGDELVFLDFKL